MENPADATAPDAAASECPGEKRRETPQLDRELTLATRADGVIAVQGSPDAVERFTERIQTVIGSPHVARATQLVSMAGSSIDAIPGVGEGSQPTVFKFSQRALELLRNNNLIAAGDGYFRSLVSDGKQFTDNLDWQPVLPETDVLQLQTAAVGLALQATVKSLADAVQRVENRVDELRDLVRSGQVGEVLGQHRVLRERLAMIDGPTSSGLSQTDWAAVAHLQPHIVSGLERTRYFIRSRMGMVEPGRMVRSRVDAAERLIDANLADALGLLATSEYNHAGWQRLRLDRVRRTEPGHLDSVLVDMESSLDLHRNEDQGLVNDLVALIDTLMEPTGLEGLELLKRRRLIRHVEEIHEATTTFARQRDLVMPPIENGNLNTFRESVRMVSDRTRDGGRWALGKARTGGSAARRVLPRRHKQPELAPAGPPDAPHTPDTTHTPGAPDAADRRPD
ncbi:MAG: hypothetical protein ACJAR2_002956 [Ilumatobacter sp.]|jgi:hypothetical protein